MTAQDSPHAHHTTYCLYLPSDFNTKCNYSHDKQVALLHQGCLVNLATLQVNQQPSSLHTAHSYLSAFDQRLDQRANAGQCKPVGIFLGEMTGQKPAIQK